MIFVLKTFCEAQGRIGKRRKWGDFSFPGMTACKVEVPHPTSSTSLGSSRRADPAVSRVSLLDICSWMSMNVEHKIDRHCN